MGWSEIDDKLKRGLDSSFVACTEGYELTFIKKVVKGEFPHLLYSEIESAINQCCNEVKAPRHREDFIKYLKQKLE